MYSSVLVSLVLGVGVGVAGAVQLQLVYDSATLDARLQQGRRGLARYRPRYHLSAPVGWLNKPAGFAYFKYMYHVFYQYHPYNGPYRPSYAHWGHAVSENLVDWTHYPSVLAPKEKYDERGCLAGSALVNNNYLSLFYTGEHVYANITYHTQNVALSVNGIVFEKYLYNPVVKEPQRRSRPQQKNPRVWRHRDLWYMLVGSSTSDRRGCLLLYTSRDMFGWQANGTVAESQGDMGYLWENPDMFELDGYHVVVISVRGMLADRYRYKNVIQTGYVVGKFNYRTLQLDDAEFSSQTFNELDMGHDFYAIQSTAAPDGRRLLVGWLGMLQADLDERYDQYTSFLSVVREVTLDQYGRLLMNPVREVTSLRSEILEEAWYSPGEAFKAESKVFELVVKATNVRGDVVIFFEWGGDWSGYYMVAYYWKVGCVSVDRGGVDGVRKADWVHGQALQWRIFVDASSIEVFCGGGEVVFSSRIFPKKSIMIRVAGDTNVYLQQYKMRRSMKDYKVKRYYVNDTDARADGKEELLVEI